MKTYEIRWLLSESGTECITANSPKDAEKRFRRWSLNSLVGHDTNTAQILRIVEREDKDENDS